MKLLLDQNVPVVLVGWLQARGEHPIHLKYTAMTRASDLDIARWARGQFDAVVTKDKDFQNHIPISLHDTLQLVHLRIGNAQDDMFISWFAPRWPAILASLQNGDQVIEVL